MLEGVGLKGIRISETGLGKMGARVVEALVERSLEAGAVADSCLPLASDAPLFDSLIVNGSLHGSCPGLVSTLFRASSFTVAADSGAALLLEAGLTPDALVGDMDSIDPSDLEMIVEMGVERIEVDPVKDSTDLELAIQIAESRSSIGVCVTGFSGGRIDHELAAIGSMSASRRVSLAVDLHCTIVFMREGEELDLSALGLEPGDEYSVMVCHGPATVSQRGVRYPQRSIVIEGLCGLGVSNVVESSDSRVACEAGRIAVVLTY